MTDTPRLHLVPWAIFAALIASAGLPIYIHAPKFYVDEYGVSLASLGLVLFGLRLVDVLQDPALGWLAEKTRTRRRPMVAAAVALMALFMLGLFAITPPTAPLIWFTLTLAGVFSAFSFLTICFYAQGVEKAAGLEVARLGMARLGLGNPGAGSPGGSGHLRLAGWREAGALIGISLAAVAPSVLAVVTLRPFAAFALVFAALALLAALAMRMEWTARGHVHAAAPFAAIGDPVARRLLLLAMVNAAPVAVTSSLFLFFVESRLQAPGLEGPLLLLFFAAAAVTAPIWSRLAARFGAKRVLMAGMGLAVAAFGFAMLLRAGDIAAFAAISAASGAALAADMVLLPAIFARHLARTDTPEAAAFGLWSFASKLSLALAVAVTFPLLQAGGFSSGLDNPEPALARLTLLYAGLPCALKLLAIALLARTPIPEA